jgi:hypothetical protein
MAETETRVFMRERSWDPSMTDAKLRAKLTEAPEIVLRNLEALNARATRARKTRLVEIEQSL